MSTGRTTWTPAPKIRSMAAGECPSASCIGYTQVNIAVQNGTLILPNIFITVSPLASGVPASYKS